MVRRRATRGIAVAAVVAAVAAWCAVLVGVEPGAARTPEPPEELRLLAPVALVDPEVAAVLDLRAPVATIDGLGSQTSAAIPPEARQVVVTAGDGPNESSGVLTRWERDADGRWRAVGDPVLAHNGTAGWTDDPRAGDLRSPVGVFGLTAAGGAWPDPGSGLAYHHDPRFYVAEGRSVDGTTTIEGAFDHVVAVDFNRVPGAPPGDARRPLGVEAGGDIWLHVDHGSGTRGCIGVAVDELAEILRWLDPGASPVIVMGDAARLAS